MRMTPDKSEPRSRVNREIDELLKKTNRGATCMFMMQGRFFAISIQNVENSGGAVITQFTQYSSIDYKLHHRY